ncbi:ETEC_3214 domain-containing protein [Vibrio harveyi]|uniref:ETEC_3214 domain-containing protein n=1 Tax=Vibrio harveyi TaxID=669 RepID=UPI003BB60C35
MLEILKKYISIAGLVAAFALLSYFNDAHDFYNNFIKQKRAEDDLKLLNTGVSIQHVKSVFGAPITESKNKKEKVTEYIYSFKNFYLQVVFSDDNEVVFYAVTSKSDSFQPSIPYLRKNLGSTFFELSDHYTKNEADRSSRFYTYAENIYLANPGNYRHLYLAHNAAGANYGGINGILFDEVPNPTRESSEIFRKDSYPNTFGVGEIHGNWGERETAFGVGIEFFSSRDLPEHNF